MVVIVVVPTPIFFIATMSVLGNRSTQSYKTFLQIASKIVDAPTAPIKGDK